MSKEKRGLIGDFEYAKRVVGGGKLDVRTVCDQIYFFNSYTNEINDNTGDPWLHGYWSRVPGVSFFETSSFF